MASNGVDFADVRRRVAAFRKPELHECLERLGMRKTGNKPELQQRLLDIFENSCHLVNNGYSHRDMWRVTSAQRIIEDVYNKLINGSAAVPLGGAPGPAAAGAAGGAGAGGSGAGAGATAPVGGPGAGQQQQPQAAAGGGAPVSAAAIVGAAAAGGGAAGAAANGEAKQGARPHPAAPATGGNPVAGALQTMLRQQPGNRAAAAPGPAAALNSFPASNLNPSIAANNTIRCTCGATTGRPPLLQCRGCGVWQHPQCAGLALGEKPAGGGEFCCEVCRAMWADPFWAVEEAGITPALRLASTGRSVQVPASGGPLHKVRTVDRTFSLTGQQHTRVRTRDSDRQLQLACLQLNDAVPFRFHWPLGSALDVNGVQYRVCARSTSQKLGPNGRDEPANIASLCVTGRNRIQMSCTDNQPYVLLVLLVRRRSAAEVRLLMRPQLSLRDAVARVQQQLRGDDDDELETGATVLSLRCPLLGSRVRTPARFAQVPGLACFDLQAFLDSARATRKWQCPHSMAHCTVSTLQIDTYTQRIVAALEGTDVTEVEVAADGGWRPAGSGSRFFSIEEDNPLAAEAAAGAGARVRSGEGAGPSGAGGGGEDSDGEETDEEEELRRAAAAVAGQKRKRAPSPDVINLASSDEEDEGGGRGNGGGTAAGGVANGGHQHQGPTAAGAAAAAAGAAGAGAAAAGLPPVGTRLRITLPTRRLTVGGGTGAAGVGGGLLAGAGGGSGTTPRSADAAAAAAAAGVNAGLVAMQRQHFEHVAALHRSSHGVQGQGQQPQQGQGQEQQPHGQQQQGQQGQGQQPAEADGGMLTSHRQPLSATAAARNTIRISTAATAAGGGGGGAAPGTAATGGGAMLQSGAAAAGNPASVGAAAGGPSAGPAEAVLVPMPGLPGLQVIHTYPPHGSGAAQGPAGATARAPAGLAVHAHPQQQQGAQQGAAPQQQGVPQQGQQQQQHADSAAAWMQSLQHVTQRHHHHHHQPPPQQQQYHHQRPAQQPQQQQPHPGPQPQQYRQPQQHLPPHLQQHLQSHYHHHHHQQQQPQQQQHQPQQQQQQAYPQQQQQAYAQQQQQPYPQQQQQQPQLPAGAMGIANAATMAGTYAAAAAGGAAGLPPQQQQYAAAYYAPHVPHGNHARAQPEYIDLLDESGDEGDG